MTRKKTVSLRRVLVASLLIFALVPASLVAWLMARSSDQAVQDLAGGILFNVAARIQAGTEAHLGQAHTALNGLFPENLSAAQTELAREWLRQSALFEPMAFALSRQSPHVPSLYFGNNRGEYFSVESSSGGATVLLRGPTDTGLQAFMVRRPGDRSRALAVAQAHFEPRTKVWYQGALAAKGRIFSPIQAVPGKSQLFVTLSQPVYDSDGGAAGVFGADLYLQQLADLLQTQRLSARGAAFIVDEAGWLVAGSAGDTLFEDVQGQLARRSPQTSANPVIRASFLALQLEQARKREDSVASNTTLQRLPMQGGGTLMTVQRPFGESLGLRWTLVVAAPESDFTTEITRAWEVSLMLIGALVLLGAGAAFYVANRIGRRLRRLSVAAQKLGRGEVPRIDSGTHLREVMELSRVMHDSAEQLKNYRSEVQAKTRAIEEANELLEDRVAQRTVELLASREEALQAARAKAAFLATMSHEIRTPLNGVVGMSTLLAETALDDEQSDYLQTIRLSSDQLLAVINDILDFSKIESGKLDLEAEPLSLRGTIEEACDIAAPRAREKNLELIVDVPEAAGNDSLVLPAAISGDVTRIRQVLINLINNAVKFTEEGEVTVSVRPMPSLDSERVRVEFRVTDSGIGIPADRVSALFQAFTQVDASTTRKYGGTGLGLAICKRLVELMGGDIGVDSVPGQGSSFWFTVQAPLAELPPVAAAVDAAALHGKRALVVDDHLTNVRVLSRQLQMWGMQVSKAESGTQALQALALAQSGGALPDIVITDMHMPGMDGVALARSIKARPAMAKLPLVLLTSGFMPPGHEAAQLFEARLLKPARQRQLFDALARCLSAQGSRKLPQDAPTRAEDASAAKNLTLLVVDDNAVNLKVACAMLAKLGYRTATAIDGREAVQAVARAHGAGERFGAVLMDINMPRMNGFQATQQIQTMMGKKAPTIIALTAAASSEDRARCAAAGMDDYLTKPLHVAALAQVLERWLPLMKAASQGASGFAASPQGFGRAADSESPATTPVSSSKSRSAAEPLLMDLERLAQFKEFDDDQLSMTREVIALFIADASQRLKAIEESIRANDAVALAWASHALVGATSNVGAVAMHAVCSELELVAKTGVVPVDAPQQLERLQAYWTKTREILDSWA